MKRGLGSCEAFRTGNVLIPIAYFSLLVSKSRKNVFFRLLLLVKKGNRILKNNRLKRIIFFALCCDFGLFAKRLIAPLTNMITDALHIPGGIATSFSLMFLVIAAILMPGGFCSTIMSAAQSVIAFSFGMVGSMGLLAPIGYIVPGFAIDLVLMATAGGALPCADRMALANGIAAASAAFTANCIVFHLRGIVLLLYVCTAFSSGIFCGLLGSKIVQRLAPVFRAEVKYSFKTRKGKEELSI